MAYVAKGGEIFEEIGFTALRDPDGSFLPSVPMYIRVSKECYNPKTGMSDGEEKLIKDISGVFADKMRQYIEGGGVIGANTEKRRKPATGKRGP